MCGAFARDVRFEIPGASNGGILAITAHGVVQLRPLAMHSGRVASYVELFAPR
jgi:hypothetical protein